LNAIPKHNIVKIDFFEKKYSHNTREENITNNPGHGNQYDGVNFFNYVNKNFSEINYRFLIIFAHGTSNAVDHVTKFSLGGDDIGDLRTGRIKSRDLINGISKPTFIFMSTCHSYSFVNDVKTLPSNHPKKHLISCMSVVSLYGGQFGSAFESLNFINEYHKTQRGFTTQVGFDHMFGSQLIQDQTEDDKYTLQGVLRHYLTKIGEERGKTYGDMVFRDAFEKNIADKIKSTQIIKLTNDILDTWITGPMLYQIDGVYEQLKQKLRSFFENDPQCPPPSQICWPVIIGDMHLTDDLLNRNLSTILCRKL
jgi:hypothetical protein